MSRRGFTLIELLVVIAVIAVLGGPCLGSLLVDEGEGERLDRPAIVEVEDELLGYFREVGKSVTDLDEAIADATMPARRP